LNDFTFGPVLSPDAVLFRLWAPLQDAIAIKVDADEPKPMSPVGDGWYELSVPGAGPGSRYQFILPNGLAVSDPASRYQPEDVHGPSEVVDLDAYAWKTADWTGRRWEEMVIYELHVGAFTPEGTFRAAIDRLDHLKALGVTAIEVMPVSDFPGSFGWGYDGVLPYAPDGSYGRPEDFMAFIDAAHERGLSVFLDVVYNHFGPEGNYFANYAPLFTDHHLTPWGNGVNYDAENCGPVRDYVIENAIYWITTFRLDGLRLDAVHAIEDDSPEHLLHALARRVREAAKGRHVHLIAENEDNDADLLRPDDRGRPKQMTAQWNDDIHHALHVLATGETFGYYADYTDAPAQLGRALAEGFVFQGEHMEYRGTTRGTPSEDLPSTAFVSFIQNHDQIGNRALGDRMIASHPLAAMKAIAAVYLLAPQVPMLFMGEEWGAAQPFPFFCDLGGDLRDLVRDGRREELSRLPGFDVGDFIDPTDPSTFELAKLDWSESTHDDGKAMLAFYRDLLEIRQARIVPLLKLPGGSAGNPNASGTLVAVDWSFPDGTQLHLIANLGDSSEQIDGLPLEGEPVYSLGSIEDGHITPWSVVWNISRA